MALTLTRCDCKRDAVRGVRLSHLPPILSFHLARFRYRRVETQPGCMGCLPLCGERDGDHRLVKLTTPLRFSQTLRMAEFTVAESTAVGGGPDASADASAESSADAADASSAASPDVSRRLDLELTDADDDGPPAAAAISATSFGARSSAERPAAVAAGEPQPQPQPPQQVTSQQQQAGLDYKLYAALLHRTTSHRWGWITSCTLWSCTWAARATVTTTHSYRSARPKRPKPKPKPKPKRPKPRGWPQPQVAPVDAACMHGV